MELDATLRDAPEKLSELGSTSDLPKPSHYLQLNIDIDIDKLLAIRSE